MTIKRLLPPLPRIMNNRISLKKLILVLLLLFTIGSNILIYINGYYDNINKILFTSICNYDQEWNDGKTLPNVADNPKLHSHHGQRNIFFHETSCSSSGVVNLTSRQACAIESAANMNPNHEVFVLFSSQVGFRTSTRFPVIDAVLLYPNVNFNYVNLTQYAENTPLANWLKNGKLNSSKNLITDTSDVFRFLSLWKYGGTYLDLDIVMLKSLDLLKPNYACAESDKDVAVGIISLENDFGREIANRCVNNLMDNFDGNEWGINGPGVMTRVLNTFCNTKDVKKMVSSNVCKNFQVLPVESCYSISHKEWEMFFLEENLNETMSRLNTSVIAHVWNRKSAGKRLTTNMNVAYIELAKKYCPRTVEVSEIF